MAAPLAVSTGTFAHINPPPSFPAAVRYVGDHDRTYRAWHGEVSGVHGIWVNYRDHDTGTESDPVRVCDFEDYWVGYESIKATEYDVEGGGGNDLHAAPAIQVVESGAYEGRLVVCHGYHNAPMECHVSPNAEDITGTWSSAKIDTAACDYPQLHAFADGTLTLLYRRDLRSNPAVTYMAMRTWSAGTWSGMTEVLRPLSTDSIAYFRSFSVGDEIHVGYFTSFYNSTIRRWDWRHLYTGDKGATWKRSDGTQITLPATNAGDVATRTTQVYASASSSFDEVGTVVAYGPGDCAMLAYIGDDETPDTPLSVWYCRLVDGAWQLTDVTGDLPGAYMDLHPTDDTRAISGAHLYTRSGNDWSDAGHINVDTTDFGSYATFVLNPHPADINAVAIDDFDTTGSPDWQGTTGTLVAAGVDPMVVSVDVKRYLECLVSVDVKRFVSANRSLHADATSASTASAGVRSGIGAPVNGVSATSVRAGARHTASASAVAVSTATATGGAHLGVATTTTATMAATFRAGVEYGTTEHDYAALLLIGALSGVAVRSGIHAGAAMRCDTVSGGEPGADEPSHRTRPGRVTVAVQRPTATVTVRRSHV